MCMSEFCCYVMLNFWMRSPAIYPWNTEKLGTRDMPSRNWNRRSLWVAAPKSLVHVEYEKLLENDLGAQGTFNSFVPNPRVHPNNTEYINIEYFTNWKWCTSCNRMFNLRWVNLLKNRTQEVHHFKLVQHSKSMYSILSFLPKVSWGGGLSIHEVDAWDVIAISRACLERCCSN